MTQQFDFTHGNVGKKMAMFAVPILLTNILQTSYQFIDSLWVGNLLGTEALGALSMASPVIFTVLSFIIGVNSSTLTVLSQKKGESDDQGLKDALNSFVFVLAILAVSFGVLGIVFAEGLLRLLQTPESVLPMAAVYLRINFCGILFLFGYNFINTILRALGDSRTPIRFVFLAVLLNAILDPLFIHVFSWGIQGAACATVLAQGSAFVYGLIHSIIKADVPFSVPRLPGRQYFTVIFKLGTPAGLQMMAISAGSAAITSVAALYGTHVLAGFGASQRINNLIMIPATTLGTAVTSMAGQNIGAGEWGRVNAITKNGLIAIVSVMLGIGALVFIFSEQLISWFVGHDETVAFGSQYLKAVAFFYPFLGINFVLNGAVRASGAMFQVLVLNLISFWLLRYPLTYLFAKWMGSEGIAFGIAASFIISSFFAIGYYVKGGWRSIQIFSKE
ncbi:MATE family efflux transporter [Tuberibacillus sp. Marseille-P3662]|uniref:MATE family efflux transporter n=1 Tax=Tuberibacillus sp. Marseille-P3662 TaxID=1965358 RepID=UPI0020CAF993|nr:MATE family efflux transporter [Tuberibacillus sp. Marseille-P3662]